MRSSVPAELGEYLKIFILPLSVAMATALQLWLVPPGVGDPTATVTATATVTPTVAVTSTSTPTQVRSEPVLLLQVEVPLPAIHSTATPSPPSVAIPNQILLPVVRHSLPTTPTPTPTSTPTPTGTPTPTPAPTPTPMPTPDGVAREVRVPILMYHHIAIPPPDADAIGRDLTVAPQDFEKQLDYLVKAGYDSITLGDLIYHLAIGQRLPRKPIVLTFDDGYRDNYTQAYPLLKTHGFVGTFFLITAPIDQENDQYLSWDQVREMSDGGMEFEPHTYTHPDLREQPVDYVVWQVMAAKEAIEERTGKTSRFFSYPSGMYDQQVVDVLRSAYFWGAVTTSQSDKQSLQHPFELNRIRVRGSDTLDDFAAKLHLDWEEVEGAEEEPPSSA